MARATLPIRGDHSCKSWILGNAVECPENKPSNIFRQVFDDTSLTNDLLSTLCLSNPKSSNVSECKDLNEHYKGKWVVFKVNHPIIGDRGLDDKSVQGQNLQMYVSGSVPRLGSWNIEMAAPMTRHTKGSAVEWWDLLFMLPTEAFSYTYLLKDCFGGVVWKSPMVRHFTTKCAMILDIITMDEVHGPMSLIGASVPDLEASKLCESSSERRCVAASADFVIVDSEHSVQRVSRRDLAATTTGGMRKDKGPSLVSVAGGRDLPVRTVCL